MSTASPGSAAQGATFPVFAAFVATSLDGFLAAGLLAEITVTTIPILLGAGRPLFGPLAHDVALEHLSTHAYPFGFVQSRYAVRGASTARQPGGRDRAASS